MPTLTIGQRQAALCGMGKAPREALATGKDPEDLHEQTLTYGAALLREDSVWKSQIEGASIGLRYYAERGCKLAAQLLVELAARPTRN